jgi:hypothetical protein
VRIVHGAREYSGQERVIDDSLTSRCSWGTLGFMPDDVAAIDLSRSPRRARVERIVARAASRSPSGTLDALEEFGDPKRQGAGEAVHVDERQVAGAALDVAQVGAVDAGLVREVFLGQAQLWSKN